MIRESILKEMKVRGDNPNNLSKKIGVHSPSLYNYFNNKAGLRYDVLEKIMKEYELSIIKIL